MVEVEHVEAKEDEQHMSLFENDPRRAGEVRTEEQHDEGRLDHGKTMSHRNLCADAQLLVPPQLVRQILLLVLFSIPLASATLYFSKTSSSSSFSRNSFHKLTTFSLLMHYFCVFELTFPFDFPQRLCRSILSFYSRFSFLGSFFFICTCDTTSKTTERRSATYMAHEGFFFFPFFFFACFLIDFDFFLFFDFFWFFSFFLICFSFFVFFFWNCFSQFFVVVSNFSFFADISWQSAHILSIPQIQIVKCACHEQHRVGALSPCHPVWASGRSRHGTSTALQCPHSGKAVGGSTAHTSTWHRSTQQTRMSPKQTRSHKHGFADPCGFSNTNWRWGFLWRIFQIIFLIVFSFTCFSFHFQVIYIRTGQR